MPKITIDGKPVECREGVPVLQAALEAGMAVPHYCYHPGLTVVASCRLCLMQTKQPDPRTKEMVWSPKLLPSCQTPVRDGMEVRFQDPAVASSVKHTMEYYLINHPLDCPVCDKAGECWLQDYAEDYGPASSRMVEEKNKNPKKDIGSNTLLYQDRCVLCTRCVRFTKEVAGTSELCVVNRGSRGEIDVFPGVPLENPLQGNVVDLCPVGALLDRNFLFKQRVWNLRTTPSVSPADACGNTIFIDHNDDVVYRVRPRFNEQVNQWWISDENRFGWKYIHSEHRVRLPLRNGDGTPRSIRWEEVGETIRMMISQAVMAGGHGEGVAAVLSPMMSCEEAWLLARFIRQHAPQATLVRGFVPVEGADQKFPKGFVISAEKCPNRRGVETIIEKLGGPSANWDEFLSADGQGRYQFAFVVGGYPKAWITPEAAESLRRVPTLVVHDIFPTAADAHAALRIPGVSFAEREGCYMNRDGLVQPFERAIRPLEGAKSDGQFFYELSGQRGLFRAARVREQMAAELPQFANVFVPRPEPEYSH
jgi:NADH-quinone oxidoreductase subunit G